MAGLTLLILLLVALAQALLLPLLRLLHAGLAPHGGLALLLAVGILSWLLLGDGDGDGTGRGEHNPAPDNYAN